ncbi:hypothetical protein T265_10845 [Opisthorchis viverrini]|uniref:Cadherin domain-containing protein n=1 Tax=Opisthorchis viverrini TaxID=6198 RepID=A0A074ZBU0_OPIVI|nr:hypothetical protein T265_10845 [Opisthorchis viverrini]KER20655.1 hypothetical protein T265_10845 [Opisthorchis viverrini]
MLTPQTNKPLILDSPRRSSIPGLRKLRVQISEEEPEGQEVANLRFLINGWSENAKGFPNRSAKHIDNFQIFNSEPQSTYFQLDPTSGRLRIARRIDRDQLCPVFHSCCPRSAEDSLSIELDSSDPPANVAGEDVTGQFLPECRLDLNIRSDDQYSNIILVHVHIVDVNDNAPVWPHAADLKGGSEEQNGQHGITVHLSENSLIGDSTNLPSAYDADAGLNGIVRYTLKPEVPEFDLKWTTDSELIGRLYTDEQHLFTHGESQYLGARHELRLVVKKLLDREQCPFYDLTVTAFDGGSPSRNASTPLKVIVTDANDNSPRFQKDTYTVELMENSKPHTSVVQVTALDDDEGVNGRIKYRFSPLTKPEFMRMFKLDAVTGWIRVQWEVDYELYKKIILTVEAVDSGQLPRASTCVVEIVVLDENDHAPEIRFEPAFVTNYALVPENENPAGRLVAVFTVTDRDAGENGRVACQLAEPSRWHFQSPDPKIIKALISADPPNAFFKLQHMQVPFSVIQTCGTSFVGQFKFRGRTSFLWMQSCGSSSRIPITSAIDSSLDRTSRDPLRGTRYMMVSAKCAAIALEPSFFPLPLRDTGLCSHILSDKCLVVRPTFDARHDHTNEYTQKLAAERGNLSFKQNLMVGLELKLKHRLAAKGRTSFFWMQSCGSSSRIPIASAIDSSLDRTSRGPFRGTRYMMVSAKCAAIALEPGFFPLPLRDTGLCSRILSDKCLVVRPTYDARHEHTNGYTQKLVVERGNLSFKQNLIVGLELKLKHRLAAKYVCSLLSVLFERHSDAFTPFVHQRYKLTTAAVFDREAISQITVLIVCSDYGQPPRNTSGAVAVRITDMNDVEPKFPRERFYMNVREDVLVGSILFTVNATDFDEGRNAKLTYWLSGPDMDYFAVNENNGEISVRRPMDRELKSSLHCRIHAVDQGTPPLNSSADVLVSVTDVNDNPPVITERVEFEIKENHAASAPIGQLTASDRDAGRNAEVSFSLVQCLAHPLEVMTSSSNAGQGNGSWTRQVETLYTFLVAKDGRIFLGQAKLDRESFPAYDLVVKAEDHGQPRLSATSTVLIRILDVNDNAPTFTFPSSGNNTVYVPRSTEPGLPLTTVQAFDRDSEDNGRVRYTLKGDRQGVHHDLFSLDSQTGELRLRRSVDQRSPLLPEGVQSNSTNLVNNPDPHASDEASSDVYAQQSAFNLLITVRDKLFSKSLY